MALVQRVNGMSQIITGDDSDGMFVRIDNRQTVDFSSPVAIYANTLWSMHVSMRL